MSFASVLAYIIGAGTRTVPYLCKWGQGRAGEGRGGQGRAGEGRGGQLHCGQREEGREIGRVNAGIAGPHYRHNRGLREVVA